MDPLLVPWRPLFRFLEERDAAALSSQMGFRGKRCLRGMNFDLGE